MNTYPDGVELVLVDDDREYTNPTYVLYLIALNEGLLSDICTPPQAQPIGALLPRTFATFPYDQKTYTATCEKILFNGGYYRCKAKEQ